MQRTKSLIVIFLIYLAALGLGILTAFVVPWESLILRVLAADIVATLFVYVFSTLFKNSSVYDPYWSVAPLVMAPFFVQALNPASILLLFVLYYWGIRLTANWVYTFKGLARYEDWRYAYFRKRFPRLWPLVNLFGIHLMPTVVVFLVMIPAFLFLQNAESLAFLVLLGAAMSIAAASIQLVSDTQMHRFRKHSGKAVLDEGLWRYSRHPNYFGEVLMWFGVYVMMLGVAFEHWFAVFGPLMNLLMFIAVSIPLMENRQLERRPAYKEYKEKTPPLIPWFPSQKEGEETAREEGT